MMRRNLRSFCRAELLRPSPACSVRYLLNQTGTSVEFRYNSVCHAMAAVDDVSLLLEEDKPQQSSIHRQLKVLKDKISELSKTNYELEREVRFFDQRIGLLINHKKAVEELPDYFGEGDRNSKYEIHLIDNDTQQEKYGNLFFLLQTEANYLAQLTRIVSLAEIDDLLQPVLFSLYGNQYELREEHLLLTMFSAGSEV
ncbi:hypothetical protein OS493_022914 [Desmophyllum pertusum]|uniref:Uncharacterized protein n=1 Tax=Desmophyllum pertusum TaxID=174260 RepID=A0A9W9ZMY9_9CNID|nr:hypothetical protein OS493_022914 [Desmophyllum pertusum]